MRILAIETSCDETGAAVVEDGPTTTSGLRAISNIVASSLTLHAKTGGIVPEVAAREQVRSIIPVIDAAMSNVKCQMSNIDAIAVTVGPGLIGSLLVGVETAKTLAYAWKKPIIPVNHLIGHIYANFVRGNSKFEAQNSKFTAMDIQFPALALVVSGGHTDLVLMKRHGNFNWLGGTRDDAAGEAFDKIGRLLGLGYPGGPSIALCAMEFKIQNLKFKIKLQRPLITENTFDFSFSGLKTAVFREINKLKINKQFNHAAIQQLAFEVQQAIVDVLVTKTIRAAQRYKVKSILLGGGVAANDKLREQFKLEIRNSKLEIELFAPAKSLCTDNAAMIAAAAFFNYKPVLWQKIKVDPGLHF